MSFLQRFREFISSPSHKRTAGIVIMLVVVAAVALTVVVSQQQQTIKQRASEFDDGIVLKYERESNTFIASDEGKTSLTWDKINWNDWTQLTEATWGYTTGIGLRYDDEKKVFVDYAENNLTWGDINWNDWTQLTNPVWEWSAAAGGGKLVYDQTDNKFVEDYGDKKRWDPALVDGTFTIVSHGTWASSDGVGLLYNAEENKFVDYAGKYFTYDEIAGRGLGWDGWKKITDATWTLKSGKTEADIKKSAGVPDGTTTSDVCKTKGGTCFSGGSILSSGEEMNNFCNTKQSGTTWSGDIKDCSSVVTVEDSFVGNICCLPADTTLTATPTPTGTPTPTPIATPTPTLLTPATSAACGIAYDACPSNASTGKDCSSFGEGDCKTASGIVYHCDSDSWDSVANCSGAPIAPAPTVKITGRHVDQYGNSLTADTFPTKTGRLVMVSRANGSSAGSSTSSPTWSFDTLPPGTYKVSAFEAAGYSIFVSSCMNCAINASSVYVPGSSVTVNLPTGGNSADIYFKYTPSSVVAAAAELAANQAAAKSVTDKILALPLTASLTLANKDAVESANTAFNALTPAQKALVTNTNAAVLSADVSRIAELQAAADIIAACPLKSKGDAGGNIDGTCDGKIDMADFNIWRNEYLKITTTSKGNFDGSSDGVTTDDFVIWKTEFLNFAAAAK